jgi:hypothetical protein
MPEGIIGTTLTRFDERKLMRWTDFSAFIGMSFENSEDERLSN